MFYLEQKGALSTDYDPSKTKKYIHTCYEAIKI